MLEDDRVSTDRFDAVLEGLADQARAGLAAEDAASAAERALAEFAEVSLLARLRCSGSIRLDIDGLGCAEGFVRAVGHDVVLLNCTDGEYAIAARAILGVANLPVASRAGSTIDDRLGLTAILRGWAADRCPVLVIRPGAPASRGIPVRVGADHLDLVDASPGDGGLRPVTVSLPLRGISAVIRR